MFSAGCLFLWKKHGNQNRNSLYIQFSHHNIPLRLATSLCTKKFWGFRFCRLMSGKYHSGLYKTLSIAFEQEYVGTKSLHRQALPETNGFWRGNSLFGVSKTSELDFVGARFLILCRDFTFSAASLLHLSICIYIYMIIYVYMYIIVAMKHGWNQCQQQRTQDDDHIDVQRCTCLNF